MEWTPRVERVATVVRSPHPISVFVAAYLARRDSRQSGAIRLGEPAVGTRRKYGGEVRPPQMFIGFNPRRASAGSVLAGPYALPATQAPSGTPADSDSARLLNLIGQIPGRP